MTRRCAGPTILGLVLSVGAVSAPPALGQVSSTDTAASAETGSGLGSPEPGVPPAPRPRPRREVPPSQEEAQDATDGAAPPDGGPPWTGPRVELGYTHYVLADGFGGGDVHAGLFGGYLATGVARLGASLELGSRDYSLAQDDALARAAVLVGYQHLDWAPFVPYAGVVGTLGWVIGKRFRTPTSRTLFGGGLEIGADLNLVRSLYVGVGLGYLRVGLGGIGRDLWVLRLRVGL